jgi:pyrroline-5-carboxylate reductase
MDAFTALAGSGPAFIYRFLDTLAAAGAQLGLDAEQTTQMALAMAEGAVQLAAQSGENPRDLAARVASAGGSTAAGLAVLDAGEALLHLIRSTLDAATRRNGELANIAERASNDKH